MTDRPEPVPVPDDTAGAQPRPPRERRDDPTQDELLDEALKETFPASDPTSVYRLD